MRFLNRCGIREEQLQLWDAYYRVKLCASSLIKRKSVALRSNPKRGIGFEETQEIFRYPYYLDRREDRPEQYRAIGWVSGRLYSVIYESREDAHGEYYHLVTLWKATKEERELYEKSL